MEHGVVIETLPDNRILVEIDHDNFCESCAAKGSCAVDTNTNKRKLWMENTIGAMPGDKVLINRGEKAVVIASMLVYLFPVIMLVAGIIIGATNYDIFHLDRDISSALWGGFTFIISFIIIKIISVILKKRNFFTPVLISVTGRPE